MPDYRRIKNISEYERCFKCEGKQYQRIGEASTWYLYSKEAVNNILKYNPNAKIIAMLRNPAKMAESLYQQFLYGQEEDAKTFQEAWALQDRRLRGECIPKKIHEPARLQYRQVCSLGRQLERLIDQVPAEQLKIILFDDFKANTKKVYDEVLDFLNLDNDGRSDFPVLNRRKTHRIKYIGKLATSNTTIDPFVKKFKSFFGIKKIGFTEYLTFLNTKEAKKLPLDDLFENHLKETFVEEILLIEKLLGIDLSHWR